MPPAPPGDRCMRSPSTRWAGTAASAVNVEGAVAAAREYGLDVVLVGDQATIERELGRHRVAAAARSPSGTPPRWSRWASQPSHALRRKRDSSMRVAGVAGARRRGVGLHLLREHRARRWPSPCSPWACCRASTARPSRWCCPNKRGRTILLDVGANIDPKPWHLAQYAVMGHVYARDILGVAEPRVGLLSVGEEEGKGNELVREVFKRLDESPINFVGNVEGRDLYNGNADVVVTDGFTGNVCLKVSESLADMLINLLREEMGRSAVDEAGRAARPPGLPAALEAGRLHGDRAARRSSGSTARASSVTAPRPPGP